MNVHVPGFAKKPEIRDRENPRFYSICCLKLLINITLIFQLSIDITRLCAKNVAFRKFKFRSRKVTGYIELTKFSDTQILCITLK